MNDSLLIFGMAVVTVLVKAGLFILGERVRLPARLHEALGFVPVTVLSAIVVPLVLDPRGVGLDLSWRNPHWVASVAAVVVCVASRRPLLTIAVGLLVFFGWRWGVGWGGGGS